MRDVTIAVPTYQRLESLARLLGSIECRATVPSGWRVRRIIVIDNDPARSAEDVVTSHPGVIPRDYLVEAVPGVVAVRNRALSSTSNGVLVFVDDDEEVVDDWPAGLLRTLERHDATLVGGPVRTVGPDGFLTGTQRDEPPEGSSQTWLRTGNLAIDIDRLDGIRFDPRFSSSGGEDVAFSMRVATTGGDLRWSASAVVHEHVGPERLTQAYRIERARHATASYYRAMATVAPMPAVTARATLTVCRSLVLASITAVRDRVSRTDPDTCSWRESLARAVGAATFWRGAATEVYGASSG